MSLDSLFVQRKFISTIQADPGMQNLFMTSPDPSTTQQPSQNKILDDDPLTVSQFENALCAATIIAESVEDSTLGGVSRGKFKGTVVLAILIYVYDDTRLKGLGSSRKSTLVTLTGNVRTVIDKYRTDPNPGLNQAWYLTKYRKPSTTYHFVDGYRESITFLELYVNQRYDNQT